MRYRGQFVVRPPDYRYVVRSYDTTTTYGYPEACGRSDFTATAHSTDTATSSEPGWPVWETYHLIGDELSPQEGGNVRSIMKPCFHVKKRQDGDTSTFTFTNEVETEHPYPTVCEGSLNHFQCRDVVYFKQLRTLKVGSTDLGSVIAGHPTHYPVIGQYLSGSSVFSEKMDDLARNAIREMTPKIDASFSLPNFLIELRDLKPLLKWGLGFLRALIREFGRLFHLTGRQLAGHHLAVEFGLLPFIADVKTIVTRLLKMSKELQDFEKGIGERLTFHYEKGLAPETFDPTGAFIGTHDFSEVLRTTALGPWRFAEDLLGEDPEISGSWIGEVKDLSYHATLEATFSVPIPDGVFRDILTKCQYWGIKPDISIVWRALPFSFLVDWVVNVTRMLERFDIDLLPVSVVIHQFCHSLRYSESAAFGDVRLEGYNGPPCSHQSSVSADVYGRWVGAPPPPTDENGETTWRTPSGYQWVLANSVAMTKGWYKPILDIADIVFD